MSDKYLEKVLESQTLSDDSEEMKALRAHRDDVEKLLCKHFEKSSPSIKYGGSKAKNTMIRESYDLDLICYFPHNETAAGETLKEIYDNVAEALSGEYFVDRKTSALRLYNREEIARTDFHIDVVPGRYFDGQEGDVFLYCSTGEKERLKTNLDVHIGHIRDSAVTSAIRLVKLWNVRNNLSVKTFIIELLVVKLLERKKSATLTEQLQHVWTKLRDAVTEITIEDPANPIGNDLSDRFNDAVKQTLSSAATRTLDLIEREGWEQIFGAIPEKAAAPAILPSFTSRPRGAFGGDFQWKRVRA